MVLVDAMKRANSVEPAKYLPEIGKTSFQGVTAKIGFDEFGDLKDGAISFYEYKGGKIEYVETLGGTPEAAPAAAAPAAAAPASAPAAAAGEKK